MGRTLVPTRAIFWSLCANIVFLLGMIGYLIMDGLDFLQRNPFNASLTAFIYVILAALFIIDSTLQLLTIYNIDRSTHRYSVMIVSTLFDKLGSYSYFLGALLFATSLTSSNTIWIFNTVGVCAFAAGAIVNIAVPGSVALYLWANSLNLLGSLCYVLAMFVTRVKWTQIIAVSGDFIYVIDAILYIICWFYDRKLAMAQGEQISLVEKK